MGKPRSLVLPLANCDSMCGVDERALRRFVSYILSYGTGMFSYVNAMWLGVMVINKVRVGLQEMPSIAWGTKLCFYFGQVEKQERKGTASMSRMYILLNKQRSERNLLGPKWHDLTEATRVWFHTSV